MEADRYRGQLVGTCVWEEGRGRECGKIGDTNY